MNSGLISRHENKGNISYKDPESCPRGGNSKGLKLSPSCDLTKVIAIHRTNDNIKWLLCHLLSCSGVCQGCEGNWGT